MLKEYKKLYAQTADRISNWRDLDKNVLADMYLQYEDTQKDLAEACIAALMCKYWNNIYKYYTTTSTAVTPEDCHDWLSHAIIYALKNRPWKREFNKKSDKNGTWNGQLNKNKIYNDPKGPDKCINMCIKSTQLIYGQAASSNNHKMSCVPLLSIQQLQDDKQDYLLNTQVDDFNPYDSWVNDAIRNEFKQKNYFNAFVLDGIVNSDTFRFDNKSKQQIFSKTKLSKYLKTLDNKYCAIFSDNFRLSLKEVVDAKDKILALNPNKICIYIKKSFEYFTKELPKYINTL